MSLVSVKKVSAQINTPAQRNEGDYGTFFGRYDSYISLKKAPGNFESMATFVLPIEIYLP